MRKGGSAERFELPLRGEPRHRWVPAFFAGAQRGQRRGGNPPAPAFPWRGKRERGRSDILAAAGLAMAGTPLVECVLALPLFSPLLLPTYISIRSIRFPEVLAGATHSFAVLLSALFMGPRWAR